MTRILMRGGKSPFEVIDPVVTIDDNLIANNSGNLLFAQSVFKSLSVPNVEIDVAGYKPPDSAMADEISEKYDFFVLPFANAFRGSFEKQLKSYTALIKKLKIPCVVIGVGAQTDLSFSQLKGSSIDESVKEFAAAVLERSAVIGVRGDVTREYLNKLGFGAVETIGCPSMYLNGERLVVEKKVRHLDKDSLVTVNITNKQKPAVGSFFYRVLKAHPKTAYIAQDIEDAKLLLWGKPRKEAGTGDFIPADLDNPFIDNGAARFFTDVPTWKSYMGDMHFSVGTRIHGNVFSILAGTPGFVIAHDSRTLELSQYYDIPHLRGDQITEKMSANDLYEMADYGPMMKGHPARFAKYKSFLEKNGLKHVYKNPKDAAAFDEKVSNIQFPAPIDAITSSDRFKQRVVEIHARCDARVDRINARLLKVEAKLAKIAENAGV
ncbi:polysaccharide pyruvyl transferase family protein [Rhizobium sp. ARZ01]|uniref:polysaccharide pyruvyl transferase family protein n=1 Tax=Rhizobium sp. ARZ01 TaxID=2769313 RepID=UPI0017874659|nr:polysaccharide pyruvyl transferase family protein [Rhizobium sp. ARZ01]MBD9373987.1 polysaccharide pyruvyl transferase family protein [Rhizobium sp. ARZ01]